MTRPESISKSCGTIVTFKKSLGDFESTRSRHQRACEIVRHFNHDIQANKYICSKRFSGIILKGELSEGCMAKLKEEDILDECEPDFEVNMSSWSTERIGLQKSLTGVSDGSELEVEADVDIFVLDTGVDPSNPYINVVEMKSFVDGEMEVEDMNGHGTQCASIIGGRGPEEFIGVVPGARIHGLKVLGKEGGGSFSSIIEAVEYTAEFKERNPNNRVVVNMSLGGYVGRANYTVLDREIMEAQDLNDIVFVIAAGNNYDDASLYCPAHVKNAITVGSYDSINNFSVFSNHGHAVDILAPGTAVQTTGLKGVIQTISGTSFAAPYVTGVVALNLLKNGSGRTKTMEMIGNLLSASKIEPSVFNVPDGTSRLSVYI